MYVNQLRKREDENYLTTNTKGIEMRKVEEIIEEMNLEQAKLCLKIETSSDKRDVLEEATSASDELIIEFVVARVFNMMTRKSNLTNKGE